MQNNLIVIFTFLAGAIIFTFILALVIRFAIKYWKAFLMRIGKASCY
jgi:hypothetical protein